MGVAQAQAAGLPQQLGRAPGAHARIGHGNAQGRKAVGSHREGETAAGHAGRDAMPHGVFHQGLHQHGRHQLVEQRLVHLEHHPQAGPEPGLLQRQVILQESQLIAQRQQLVPRGRQRKPKRVGQLGNQLAGALQLGRHRSADRVKRIEQKMRVDLGFQGRQLAEVGLLAQLLLQVAALLQLLNEARGVQQPELEAVEQHRNVHVPGPTRALNGTYAQPASHHVIAA